jgi:hypothetical protein
MQKSFSPIFIVGCERSGTTLLSAFLDRHSQVCIPPETFYFSDVFHQAFWRRSPRSRRSLLHALFGGRVGEFGLDHGELQTNFEALPSSHENLFQIVLEACAKRAHKIRCGEKSVLHVFYVPLLMRWYPQAQFLGIVRDGRDVVTSMMNQPWHPNKLRAKCCNWRMKTRLLLHWQKLYPQRFKIVHYEDLLLDNAKVLAELDAFLGLTYEAGQTDPKIKTGVYLEREHSYKSKVEEALDPSRAFAWKQKMPLKLQWTMNSIMGPTLQMLNYGSTELDACPQLQRVLDQILKAFWIAVFWVLVQLNGLILYDKIRYLWRKRARARNSAFIHEGPQP